MYRASVNWKCLPWNKQGCCQSFLLILCWLFSLSLQYGWLLFCSRLLRDWPLFFVGNNSLTVAFTLYSQIMLLITYFIWKLFTHSTQNLFSILLLIAVLHSQFFTCCRYSREVSTNEVYLWTGKWSNSNCFCLLGMWV